MQLRTVVFILLVLVVIATRANAQSSDPASLKRNLLQTSGLKEGPIELIDGNEDCIASSLRILEIDEDSHFTLTISLGAEPLVMGLGVPATKYTERGCDNVETATVSDRRVDWKNEQDCKAKGKFEYNTKITVTSTGFQYVKHNKDLTKKVDTLKRTCKYKFVH